MTKEKLLLLFIVICSLVGVKAQTTIYSCNGLYRIELPAQLELQSSELNSVKRISEQGKKVSINSTTSLSSKI